MLKADASSLRKMGSQLRKSQPALYRETGRALREVGKRVASRALENASEFAKTPPTMRVSASGVNAVRVTAGGPGADWKAIENHGKGHVRHPVFGNRQVWTEKNSPPAFLLPAAMVDLQHDTEDVRDALHVLVERTIHGQTGYF